jgi:predicted short-subunit dehydrogenase-like oxidoreductase (DUF2520 family)
LTNFIVEKIAIIGIGRLGKSLARALCEVGFEVLSLTDRTPNKATRCARTCGESTKYYPLEEIPREVTLIILTVPDGHISEMAKKIATLEIINNKTVIMHTSGSVGAQLLDPLSARTKLLASVHPVQTFSGATDDWKRLFGIYYGLEGNATALTRIKKVFQKLNGHLFKIDAEHKSLYHLGCVFASNYLISVIAAAIKVFEKLGFSEKESIKILEPLIVASADNVRIKGTALSATGPITRGDVGTVAGHLENLKSSSPDLIPSYEALGNILLDLVEKNGNVEENKISELRKLLS